MLSCPCRQASTLNPRFEITPSFWLQNSRSRLHGVAILLVGVAGGWLVMHFGVPAGLFMGGMVFSSMYRMLSIVKIAGINTFHKMVSSCLRIRFGESRN